MERPEAVDPPGRDRRGAVARVAEGFLRDALVNSAALASALIVAAGLFIRTSAWSSVAVIVGGLGMALPFLSLTRGRSTRILRTVVRGVLLVDLALLVVVLFAA